MADSADLGYLSAAELGRHYRDRSLSPVEVTRALLERIDRYDGRLRAFITVMADSALEDARRAEAELRNGEDRGPLQGVPVAVKDLYDTAGVRTTAGARILVDRVPTWDADAVERLRRAGAVLIGKTNLHEFAFGSTTINPHFGTCRNPWDSSRVPGGSSGGSAVALAAGMATLALGTDTGGSIRTPASYCGVTGLKPTYGLLSRFGIYPVAADLDHSGPYGRDARDTALLLQALAGYDPRDPTSAHVPIPDYSAALEQDVRGLRAGLLRQQLDLAAPAVRQAVLNAGQVLEGLGVQLQEVELPHEVLAVPASTVLMFVAATEHHRPLLQERSQDYGDDVRERLELGALFSGPVYLKAQRIRALLIREASAALRDVDVLLSATNPEPAPLIEAPPPAIPPIRFTRLANLLGFPALSTPCGASPEGLPLGLQIIGRPWDDALVLRLAHAYQQASGVFDYRRQRPRLDAA